MVSNRPIGGCYSVCRSRRFLGYSETCPRHSFIALFSIPHQIVDNHPSCATGRFCFLNLTSQIRPDTERSNFDRPKYVSPEAWKRSHLPSQRPRQGVEYCGQTWVITTEHCLIDRQTPSQERFSLGTTVLEYGAGWRDRKPAQIE